MKKFVLICSCFVLILSACTTHPADSQSTLQLKVLGQVVIPYNYSFESTSVGGLSGLTYDAEDSTFYVISDDRSQLAPARFYSFRVRLAKGDSLGEKSVQFTSVSILKGEDGKPYPKGSIDPEGIALGPGGELYISSEGDPKQNIAPFINAYHKDGTFIKALPIPKAYWPDSAAERTTHGIRTNLAFESLTVSPDQKHLYAATENALLQDGPRADSTHSSPARMLVYNLPSGTLAHEYMYNVDSIYLSPGKHGPFAVNGLSDMLALDNNGRFLAIERNFVQQQGNTIKLYTGSTKTATDIKGRYAVDQKKGSVQAVQKTLLANLNKLGIIIDNDEGLALGPKLSGGGRLLLMVSDNNFSATQKTVFTAFRLDM